jgi:hypothetical protein
VAACFGLTEDRHHHRVPCDRLTATHPCISVFALHREGLLVEGAQAVLQTAHGGYLIASREAGKIWIDAQPVVIGSHPTIPQKAFICPACRNIRYKLFDVAGRWACYRCCHGLTHACRHMNRMLPGWHRLMRLRGKIGASLVPFTPIEPRPLLQRKYWRIVREIRQIEAELVGHIREDVADVLERRDGRQSRP